MINQKNLVNQLIITLFIFFGFFLGSCSKENDYAERDDQSIRDYLQKYNLTAQKTASGLYYIITEAGSNLKPNANSTVTVDYKGYFLDNTVFETTYGGNAATFPLSGVIAGWREGLQLYGEGGKGTLFIPSHLAYGKMALSGIPANTVLIFDIHLINVE